MNVIIRKERRIMEGKKMKEKWNQQKKGYKNERWDYWKYNNMKQIFPLLNTITGVWELIEQESQYHTQEQGQETMNPTERIPCHTLVKPS